MKEIDENIKAIVLSIEGDQDLRERCRQIIEEINANKSPDEPR
jgi:hypothetical protein